MKLNPIAEQLQATRYATLNIIAHPLDAPTQMLVPVGRTIRECVPADAALPIVVEINGQWALEREWWRPLQHDDVLNLHVNPAGGGGGSNPLRILLTVGLIIAANAYGAALAGSAFGAAVGLSAAAATGLIIAVGSLAINVLLPQGLETGGGPSVSSNPSFNFSLQGNSARIKDPIPVLYGFNTRLPDFACQPYTTFDNDTGDQYYHALMCIGQGEYEIQRLMIDDTSLSHYSDVTAVVLEPGELPTQVSANVVTSAEVGGGDQEIVSGRTSPGFSACGPGQRATHIGVDVTLAGLGEWEGSAWDNYTVTVRFDFRAVDDFGNATSAWSTLATENITAHTQDAVRRSFLYELPTVARVEVRAVRLDLKADSNDVLNTPIWAGLRAHLQGDSTLAATATHLEVRVRATEQLNGLTQRRIAVSCTRKLRTWSPGGGWTAPVASRSIAWALADKWSDAVYGDGLADDRMGLAELYALDQTWTARQDRFDYEFSGRTDSAAADALIAAAGRAVVIRRNGIRTIVRDESKPLPVTVFSSRSINPGSVSIDYGQSTDDTFDGLIIEFLSNRTKVWTDIECPAPGYSATSPTDPSYNPALPVMSKPMRVPLRGVTGYYHAFREGRFLASALKYRRKPCRWQTEMKGLLPAYGSPVSYAPPLHGYAQAGDLVDVNGTTLELSEPPQWVDGASHFIAVEREDGTVNGPIAVTPGATANEVTLAEALDFSPVLDAADRDRPSYIFGVTQAVGQTVLIRAIRPAGRSESGAPQITIEAINEDSRVHEADNDLLPSPGETQDPIDPGEADEPGGGGGGGGEPIYIVRIDDWTSFEVPTGLVNRPVKRYTVLTNGLLDIDSANPVDISSPPFGWMLFGEIEPAVAATYEVRYTLQAFETTYEYDGAIGGRVTDAIAGFAVGASTAWLPITASRAAGVEWVSGGLGGAQGQAFAQIFVEIRDSSAVVQDSATLRITAMYADPSG